MKYPQIGSIYKIKGQICYVFHCDGIFRIREISKRKELKEGWFQDGNQKEIPLTQKWLDLLKKFHINYIEEINGYRYDLESDYFKNFNYKTLNDFLYKEFDMKQIYDFEVLQGLTNIDRNIFIKAKLKSDVFNAICTQLL